MAKTGGLGDGFLISGYDISGDASSMDQISGGPALIDVTPINAYAHVQLGALRSGTMQFTTWFDPTANFEHTALSPLTRNDVIGMYLRGYGLGNAGACINAKQLNYDPTRGNDGSLSLKVELDGNGYGLEWGLQLTTGLQTDSSATANTYLDYGAAGSNGAQMYLEVTAFTGTDATIIVQHSTDHSSWSTLDSFTQVTSAPFTQRLAVTGAVDRYVRCESTTSAGFTVLTYAVVFMFNPVAVKF